MLREFTLPACVIVKHANPCGVAVDATIEGEFERALAGDPVSAFGMVCALNHTVSATLGARIAERFVEVLYAPGYEDGALAALRGKEATRILVDTDAPCHHSRREGTSACLEGCSFRTGTGTSRTGRA